jgi:hypothetical protein
MTKIWLTIAALSLSLNVGTAKSELIYIEDLETVAERSSLIMTFSEPDKKGICHFTVTFGAQTIHTRVKQIEDTKLRETAMKRLMIDVNSDDNNLLNIYKIMTKAGWKFMTR